MGWARRGVLQYLPSPTVVPHDHLADTLSLLAPDAAILDVGAGGRRVRPDVVTVDAVPAPGVDLLGDIHRLPLADDSFDCVICTGTLEHVRDPWRATRELHRVLKPGGIIHIDVPFIQGYHPDPTDYWRFTRDGLKLLCGDFDEMACGVHIGPASATVWVLREWANSLSSGKVLSNLFLIPVAILSAPLKWLDYACVRTKRAHHVASAVFFRGRKPGAASAPEERVTSDSVACTSAAN